MGEQIRRLVWDLPTRLFHWLLVGLFGFSWWSAENDHLDWHLYSGIAVCGLMVFRLLWGVIGTDTARFSQFVRAPRAVWSYLTGKAARPLGHNPLGGWSVLALLGLLCIQVVSGLFAVDVDGLNSGPLSYLVDFDRGRSAAAVHDVSFNLLLMLAGLHILAVLYYLVVKRRNLIWSMVTGLEPVTEDGGATAARLAPRWRLLVAVILAGLLVYGLANGFRV
jgi:cytochrome b